MHALSPACKLEYDPWKGESLNIGKGLKRNGKSIEEWIKKTSTIEERYPRSSRQRAQRNSLKKKEGRRKKERIYGVTGSEEASFSD